MSVRKKKTAGKKRKMSPAQKAALAKGRAALARRRKSKSGIGKRKTVSRKKPVSRTKKRVSRSSNSKERESIVIINQGDNKMARKRKRRSTRTVAKRSRRRRSSGTYMGGIGGRGAMKKVQSMLISTVIGTGAGISGSMLIAKVPVKNTKVKASLPLLAGIAVSLFAKGRYKAVMYQAASGLMIAGGLGLAKQFAPQFALAGENELLDQAYIEDNSGLGLPAEYMGLPVSAIEENEGF